MLIIFKNGKIAAVEKKLLNTLGTGLEELSKYINLLSAQLFSLNGDSIRIGEHTFTVREIELLSTEEIKAFELALAQTNSPENSDMTAEIRIDEEPVIKDEDLLHPELKLEEPEIKEEVINPESFINPEAFLNEETPQEKPEEENIPDETQKEDENKLDVSLAIEENEEHRLEQNLTPKTPFKEDGFIEISFEDDLEEIREILSMDKEEFSQAINSELEKASSELGIEYTELASWYQQLIEQIKDEKKTIFRQIDKRDYEGLHKSYHKLKGAALNLRLSKIALVLKKLDELSKNREDINKIREITQDFYALINKNVKTGGIKKEKKIQNRQIEETILKTIKNYLETQNDAQFEKDKKYIEKLLNVKINSIEELHSLIKGSS